MGKLYKFKSGRSPLIGVNVLVVSFDDFETVGQNEPHGSDISPQNRSLKRSFYSFKNLKLVVYHVKILILQRVSVKTQVAPVRNRARVSRMVGGDSTTEPAIRLHIPSCFHLAGSRAVFSWHVMQRDMN